MADKFQIVNTALREVGSNPIADFDEGSYESDLIRDIYDQVLLQVFSQGGWTCLRKRAALVQTVEKPAFGFTNQFQMPTNPRSVKVLEFNRHNVDSGISIVQGQCLSDTPNAFQVEGDKLLTNSNVAEIVYVADIRNESEWDYQLTSTIIAALKYRISVNQGAEEGKSSRLQQEYLFLLKQNLSNNNQQASSVAMRTDTYFIGR